MKSSSSGPLRRLALNRWRAAALVEAARRSTLYDTASDDSLEGTRIGRQALGNTCDNIALGLCGC